MQNRAGTKPTNQSMGTTLPKFNSSPLKIGRNPKGRPSIEKPQFFRGELLNFGCVCVYIIHSNTININIITCLHFHFAKVVGSINSIKLPGPQVPSEKSGLVDKVSSNEKIPTYKNGSIHCKVDPLLLLHLSKVITPGKPIYKAIYRGLKGAL